MMSWGGWPTSWGDRPNAPGGEHLIDSASCSSLTRHAIDMQTQTRPTLWAQWDFQDGQQSLLWPPFMMSSTSLLSTH